MTLPLRRAGGIKSTAGFTIVEVAIATFVMAFAIASSIIALQSGFKTIDVARGTTLASQILQSEIERIRMMSWSDVVAMAGPTPQDVDLTAMYSSDTAIGAKFDVQRLVTLEPGTRENDVALITLTVIWSGYDGRTHTRRFETKYIKNGLYDYYYTLARP